MNVDMGSNEPPLAEEDMGILIAIAAHLANHSKHFRINLPNGAYLTNIKGGPVFSFSGLDAIKDALTKLNKAGAGDKYEILMPTDTYNRKTKVGNMFGMDLFADPDCDKNNFVIRQIESTLQKCSICGDGGHAALSCPNTGGPKI